MNRTELEQIVAAGESETVEFKKSTGTRTAAAKTACAMLNGKGGLIAFGVTDALGIIGQEVADGTLLDVVQELRKIEPFVPLQPEDVPIANGKSVLLLRIPGGNDGPFAYNGRAYIRQGPTTSEMPREQYERLIVERMHPTRRWELQPAHGASLDSLDATEITRTVEEGIRRGRLEEPGTRDTEAILRGLKLIDDEGHVLNAAVALFGRADTLLPYFPQCLLRLARFKGTTMAEFEDNRQVRGNVFVMLEAADRFMRQHLPVAGRIIPDLFERIDDPVYPPKALREAVANAVCHRDYSVGGGSVGIGIFDDRLEITSVGRLPFGQTTDDLVQQHTSKPWNPLIANVLYIRGVIEQWGRGTLKIVELTERADLVPAEFEEHSGSVTVRFRAARNVTLDRMTPLHRNLLDVLSDRGPMALSTILDELTDDVAKRTVQNALGALRDYGYIELRGRGPSARWMLKEPLTERQGTS
ncbi:MAG: ATP-binding protein [Rubricoccaceae bacterium]